MDEIKSSTQTTEATSNQERKTIQGGADNAAVDKTWIQLPSKETIEAEMRAVINESPKVQEALQAFAEITRRQKNMKEALAEYTAKRLLLIKKRNALNAAYGNKPSEDFKELDGLMREISVLDEAKELIAQRLVDDGEMYRAVQDAKERVHSQVGSALRPFNEKLQALADNHLDGFIAFLKNHQGALFSCWPTRTADGFSVGGGDQNFLHNKLLARDLLRLRGYTTEFDAIIHGAIHALRSHQAANGHTPPPSAPGNIMSGKITDHLSFKQEPEIHQIDNRRHLVTWPPPKRG